MKSNFENILSREIKKIFKLSEILQPEIDIKTKYQNTQYHVEEAITSMLSYTEALRVAVALHDYTNIQLEQYQRKQRR